MSKEPTSSTQNPKLLLGTAVITALTTIAVSFIGIVPQLRSGDKQELAQLREYFKGRAGVVGTSGSGEPGDDTKTLIISGTVRSDDGLRLLAGYDVYLLAAGNNLVTTTDDAGKFTFQRVPAGKYFIVIRDSSNGKSGRGFLDDLVGELQMIGAKVKYRIAN